MLKITSDTRDNPMGFVLISCSFGPMIINRLDQQMIGTDRGFGVAWELLNHGAYAKDQSELLQNILHTRREFFGDGVMAIDCGAHVGIFAVQWARLMADWGHVIGIEAQERMFYALAGNVTLNNCFNTKVIWGVVGGHNGSVRVPIPNYLLESSFASLEAQRSTNSQWIGQPINYGDSLTQPVQQITLDALNLQRADLIKLDVEGMEIQALQGALETLKRCTPVLFIDTSKLVLATLLDLLESAGYESHQLGNRLLAIHKDDPTLDALGNKRDQT